MADVPPHHGKADFMEYKAVQKPPVEDAIIFEEAAKLVDDMRPTAAILKCGGTRQHVNHFSMQVCDSKPVDPWADLQEPGIVKAELIGVADKLKGLTDAD